MRRDVASGRELDAAVTEAMAALAARAAAEPPRTKAAFSPVTTSSLAALRRYDEADALMRQDTWTAAIPLLEEALALDPAFGSAHAHLAWVLSNIGRPRADWEAQLVRAEALAPGVSEAEQAFIGGTALPCVATRRRRRPTGPGSCITTRRITGPSATSRAHCGRGAQRRSPRGCSACGDRPPIQPDQSDGRRRHPGTRQPGQRRSWPRG